MKRIYLILIVTLIICANVQAQATADADIQVECSGQSGAQVAIRWGHPNYSIGEYMPLFTARCGAGIQKTKVKILDFNSQFEVQTEGGIETSYMIKITISGPKGVESVELNHTGSPDIITRGNGFTLSRSSGPNKYGEQNFRVQLKPGQTAAVRMVAESTGDNGGTQMALRWGHPDFHENEFFPVWTVKPGLSQEKKFTLTDPRSEFEIQTEGGEGTGYHLSVWLDAGQGMGMQPSIEIAHKLRGTSFKTSGKNPNTFQIPRGNAFGEMNVRVNVEGLQITRVEPVWSQVSFTRKPITAGPVPFVGQIGLGFFNQGKFTKIRSAEPFDIELVGGGATTDDCFKANGRTRLLRAYQELPDSDFQALYGINPFYPRTLVACAYADVPGFVIQVYTIPKP